jgi:hypothetical protein
MPYLKMLLNEDIVDEVYLSDVLIQSIIGQHSILEEKERLLEKHATRLGKSTHHPVFVIDTLPSAINSFLPLQAGKSTGN